MSSSKQPVEKTNQDWTTIQDQSSPDDFPVLQSVDVTSDSETEVETDEDDDCSMSYLNLKEDMKDLDQRVHDMMIQCEKLRSTMECRENREMIDDSKNKIHPTEREERPCKRRKLNHEHKENMEQIQKIECLERQNKRIQYLKLFQQNIWDEVDQVIKRMIYFQNSTLRRLAEELIYTQLARKLKMQQYMDHHVIPDMFQL